MLTDPLLRGAIDERMIAAMRLMLALLALLSTYIDPAETTHYVAATYTVLAFYLAYSITLLTLAVRRRSTISATVVYWAEVGWDILLISSSKGTNSIFFFFFFFPILVSSFQAGFTVGMRVTLVATVLFTGIGFAMAPDEPEFELNSFLLRPTSLFVLGYMIACWGGAETMFRRRLALLKDVSLLANPRFGVDRTFGSLMERLRAFYAADMCMLVMAELPPGGYTLRRVNRQHPDTDGSVEVITEEVARVLLALPATQAQVSGSISRLWGWFGAVKRVQAYDVVTRERLLESLQDMRELLAAAAYITVPVRYRGETVGPKEPCRSREDIHVECTQRNGRRLGSDTCSVWAHGPQQRDGADAANSYYPVADCPRNPQCPLGVDGPFHRRRDYLGPALCHL